MLIPTSHSGAGSSWRSRAMTAPMSTACSRLVRKWSSPAPSRSDGASTNATRNPRAVSCSRRFAKTPGASRGNPRAVRSSFPAPPGRTTRDTTGCPRGRATRTVSVTRGRVAMVMIWSPAPAASVDRSATATSDTARGRGEARIPMTRRRRTSARTRIIPIRRIGRIGCGGETSGRTPLLHLGVVEEQHVVDPGGPVEAVADPEDVRLLVRLDDRRVFVDHLLRLPVERLPLLGIVRALRVLEDLVERLVLVDGERRL